MKAIFAIMFLCYVSGLNAQGDPACNVKEPVTVITQRRAAKRIKKFNEYKNPVLKKYNGQDEISSVDYSQQSFVSLLKQLVGGSHDGFRVYFAVYPGIQKNGTDSGYAHVPAGKENHLTLIFVPTSLGMPLPPPSKRSSHNDDIKTCFILDAGVFKPFDANAAQNHFISEWIEKYRLRRVHYLNYDGNAYINKRFLSVSKMKMFEETASIWYDKNSITNGKDGLLEFLECQNNNIETINTNFAVYLRKGKEWSYHLTLVFDLISPNKNNLLGRKNYFVTYRPTTAGSTPSDTGKPCPPPNGGCQSEGAKLPVTQ